MHDLERELMYFALNEAVEADFPVQKAALPEPETPESLELMLLKSLLPDGETVQEPGISVKKSCG